MFRFLLVEDDEPTIEKLITLFELRFNPKEEPENALQIDVATNVTHAQQLIEQAAKATKPYHAVVLDFKLPAAPGANAEVDESLCLALKQKMPEATVGHLSSHPDDPLVQAHLTQYHYESVNLNAFALSKNNNDYPKKLVQNFKTALYGRRVEAGLNRVFGAPNGATCMTHDQAQLCYDIVSFWPDLDEGARTRIQRYFHINTKTQPIELSLL